MKCPLQTKAPRGAGFCGRGTSMQVGLSHAACDFCDGQSLAPRGRWNPEDRKYPETERWKGVVSFWWNCRLEKVSRSPFTPALISELKNEVIKLAESYGLELHRAEGDRVTSRWISVLWTTTAFLLIGFRTCVSAWRPSGQSSMSPLGLGVIPSIFILSFERRRRRIQDPFLQRRLLHECLS